MLEVDLFCNGYVTCRPIASILIEERQLSKKYLYLPVKEETYFYCNVW